METGCVVGYGAKSKVRWDDGSSIWEVEIVGFKWLD